LVGRKPLATIMERGIRAVQLLATLSMIMERV
jgi:hypothetical protein